MKNKKRVKCPEIEKVKHIFNVEIMIQDTKSPTIHSIDSIVNEKEVTSFLLTPYSLIRNIFM